MSKTVVYYDQKNPTQSGVKFLAIQVETNPPYVWATYFSEDVPNLPSDLLVIRVDHALKLFNFKKGNLKDVDRG
jgi:hypothetical protein